MSDCKSSIGDLLLRVDFCCIIWPPSGFVIGLRVSRVIRAHLLRSRCVRYEHCDLSVLFPPPLKDMKKLVSLKISSSDLCGFELSAVLTECKSLTHLIVGDEVIFAGLIPGLGGMRQLTSLEVYSGVIGRNERLTFANALRGCTSLKRIVFTGNAFGSHGFGQVMENLISRPEEICADRIQLNGFTFQVNFSFQSHIHTLKRLSLAHNRLGDNDACGISTVIGLCTLLERVDLGGNSIGGRGAEFLSNSLSCSPTKSLKELILRYNCIDDDGAVELAKKSLLYNHHLKLDMSSNMVSDSATYYIQILLKGRVVMPYNNGFYVVMGSQ